MACGIVPTDYRNGLCHYTYYKAIKNLTGLVRFVFHWFDSYLDFLFQFHEDGLSQLFKDVP